MLITRFDLELVEILPSQEREKKKNNNSNDNVYHERDHKGAGPGHVLESKKNSSKPLSNSCHKLGVVKSIKVNRQTETLAPSVKISRFLRWHVMYESCSLLVKTRATGKSYYDMTHRSKKISQSLKFKSFASVFCLSIFLFLSLSLARSLSI